MAPATASVYVSGGTVPKRLPKRARATFTIGTQAPRLLEGVNKDSSLPNGQPVMIPLNARRPSLPTGASTEQGGHRHLQKKRSIIIDALVNIGSLNEVDLLAGSQSQRTIKTLEENLALLRAATMIAIPPSRIKVLRFLKQILEPYEYEMFARCTTN